jgi:bifunctional non-homologous end joining protein LigD
MKSKIQDSKFRGRFVVQEHHATHLHWDFRLEKEGVLKSWAVPKGPPEKSAIKRLAIEVEDHEINYINFEGIIPEGQYGAGTVKIWDRGTYQIESESPRRIVFNLNGKRLKGRYSLVYLKEKQWLLMKL